MGPAAGLDGDHRRIKPLEERHHILPPKLLAQNGLLGGVHPVKLKNVLRRIHANSGNLFHGRSPLSEISNDLSLAHGCRRGPSTPTGLSPALPRLSRRRLQHLQSSGTPGNPPHPPALPSR